MLFVKNKNFIMVSGLKKSKQIFSIEINKKTLIIEDASLSHCIY